MDLKAIQHEENIWNNIFKKELKKNKFEKFSSFWWEEYYNEITNFIRNNIIINLKNKNILEAGSGSGKSSLLIGNYVKKITLFDISESALKYANFLAEKLYISNISFKKGNIFNMDLKNNSFDFTWNIGTIEHYNNEDIKKILTEMFRVTENNGYIALGFPNFYSGPILKAWLNKKIPFLKGYKLDTEIFYSKNDILNIIEDINGIEIDDLKINKFGNFMPIGTPKILLFFGKRLEKFFYNNKFLTFISFKIIKNG